MGLRFQILEALELLQFLSMSSVILMCKGSNSCKIAFFSLFFLGEAAFPSLFLNFFNSCISSLFQVFFRRLIIGSFSDEGISSACQIFSFYFVFFRCLDRVLYSLNAIWGFAY